MSELECPLCSGAATGGYRGARADLRKQVSLETSVWEADIEVLRCPRCDGVFLDEGQLDQIKRTRGNDYGARDPIAMAHARAYAAAEAANVEREAVNCPRCGDEMLASEHKRSHVVVDVCLSCGGTWLTAEALQHIEVYGESGM